MSEKESYNPDPIESPAEVSTQPAEPQAPAPNLLFTTRIWYEDRSNETVEHQAAPKFVDDFIQLARTEDLFMINKKYIRKAITSVKVLPALNGHTRMPA